MATRERNRDDRDYDTTQLREAAHGSKLARDYSGHFFRWSWARRFINKDLTVLEVGCGEDKPLSKLITGTTGGAHVKHYTGVDLNRLKESKNQQLTFHGEFNFVERYKELLKVRPEGWDVLVNFEVIEHMKVEHGIKLLKAMFACTKPGGVLILSTPVYDGKRHAANHIHEYTVPELQKYVEKTGYVVERRFGVFMDIKHIGKADIGNPELTKAAALLKRELSAYYDNEAISCLFAPIYPDHARNNLWLLRRPA